MHLAQPVKLFLSKIHNLNIADFIQQCGVSVSFLEIIESRGRNCWSKQKKMVTHYSCLQIRGNIYNWVKWDWKNYQVDELFHDLIPYLRKHF